jgi:hypothetical protein
MGGLGLLIVLIGYIWLAIAIGRWAARSLPRLAALTVSLLLVILPFVDAVAGRIVLKTKCNQRGSVIVLDSIAEVEGIGVGYGVFSDSPSYYGYQFVEGGYAYKDAPWMFERAELDPVSGKVQIAEQVLPKAKYLLLESPRQDSMYFFQTRTSVNEKTSGRRIASFDWFAFRGGWVERVAMAFAGAGSGKAASCGNVKDKHEKTIAMLHAVLRPALTAPSSGQPSAAAEVKR